MLIRALVKAILCGSLLSSSTSAATVSIEEINIDPLNWAGQVLSGSSFSTTSVQLSQGTPVVNHSALRVQISNSALTTFTFDVGIYKKDASWNPAMGAIETVGYAADVVMSTPVTFAPLLYQGGNFYVPPNEYFREPGQINLPQGIGETLPISLFGKSFGPGPDRPS